MKCLKLLEQNKSIQEITYELGYSRRTIEVYLSRLLDKLRCQRTYQLALEAKKLGIL